MQNVLYSNLGQIVTLLGGPVCLSRQNVGVQAHVQLFHQTSVVLS